VDILYLNVYYIYSRFFFDFHGFTAEIPGGGWILLWVLLQAACLPLALGLLSLVP
jgi:hypothetical protein